MKREQVIDKDTILQRDQNQLFTMIDDEVVMLIVRDEEYLNLNSHASMIWQLLERPLSFDELVDRLCSMYEVGRKECTRDTMEFVGEFINKNIIKIIPG